MGHYFLDILYVPWQRRAWGNLFEYEIQQRIIWELKFSIPEDHIPLDRDSLNNRENKQILHLQTNTYLLRLQRACVVILNIKYREPLQRALKYGYRVLRCLQGDYHKYTLITTLCHLNSLWLQRNIARNSDINMQKYQDSNNVIVR